MRVKTSVVRVLMVVVGLTVGMTVATPSWGSGVLEPISSQPLQVHFRGTATLLASGKILLAGGYNLDCLNDDLSDQAEIYDPKKGTYTPAGSIMRKDQAATLLADGTVLVTGGRDPDTATTSTRLYRPASNDWVARAPMGTARYWHASVRLANGQVLVVGGNPGAATAELYDPATNTWKPAKAPLSNTGVSSQPVLMPDGRVFVLFISTTATAQIYNPGTNTWTKAATPAQVPTPWQGAAALLPDGRLFVTSGAMTSLYTPSTGKWNNVYSGVDLAASWALTLDSGDVLLVSDAGTYEYTQMPVVVRYDVDQNTWTTVEVDQWDFPQATLVPGLGVVMTSMGQDWRECEGALNPMVYREGVPAAPTATVGGANGSMRVEWTTPPDDGGSAISGYRVTFQGPGAPAAMTVSASTHTVTATGLTNGQAYTVTVTATNSRGRGLPSTTTGIPMTPACTIIGTIAADTLTGTAARDVICGLGGDDTMKYSAGEDVVLGGAGLDTVDYSAAPASVTVDLASGAATVAGRNSQTVTEMENVTGSDFADTLTGEAGPNVLKGRAGNDTFGASAGADANYGGGQDDVFYLDPPTVLNEEPSQYFGGLGSDSIAFTDGPEAVFADLKQARAVGTSTGCETSTLLLGSATLTEIESVIADPDGCGAVLRGSDGPNYLAGTWDADILRGAGGNDTLSAGEGDDQLFGDAGNDSLIGGADIDTCTGGTGTDTAQGCETKASIP